MKKTIITILLTILSYRLIIDIGNMLPNDNPIATFTFKYMVVYSGLGISTIVNKNCLDIPGENGHGWKIESARKYNDCTKLQIFISDFIYGPKG